MIKNIVPDKSAAAGTVMTQAAIIVKKWDRRTSFRRRRSFRGTFFVSLLLLASAFLERLSESHSRKKPTPNTPPTAMCVELTGSPSHEAMITVIAADRATQ